MSQPDHEEVVLVPPAGPLFDCVRALYKTHSATLGFLPRGAFEQYAEEGNLLAHRRGDELAGYLAYRLAGNEAVLVHLCVASAHRRTGVAGKLVDALFDATEHLAAIRLTCRHDYSANSLWPRKDFVCVGERPGRGQDRVPLLRWRRSLVDETPLFTQALENERRNKRTAAVDANVFIHFSLDTEEALESRSLLADWLTPDLLICVTAELRNEILRHGDPDLREQRRREISAFPELHAAPDALRASSAQIAACLPTPTRPSDESDRRQLAHAVAKDADYFVTRDGVLLEHAPALEQAVGIRVLRPVDLVCEIHGTQVPDVYAPARLVGTRLEERAPTCEEQLSCFQAFSQSETKGAFLGLCRRVLADPIRFKTQVVSMPEGDPLLLHSTDLGADGGRRIVLLRTLRPRLSATVLRRFLSEALLDLPGAERRDLWCDDVIDPVVTSALTELGFRLEGEGYVKTTIPAVVTNASLSQVAPQSTTQEVSNVEELYWPLKIADADTESYVVPIRPHWAAELFDAELAAGGLFGADVGLALALENAYYSRAKIQIPAGARILWYVSGDVGAVRACSLCRETQRGAARDVFSALRRLGVFRWQHILDLAGGDPHEQVTAYRFAFTERFQNPVRWARLQELLRNELGHGNQIAGPVRIPPSVFAVVYSQGTGRNLPAC